VDVIPWKKHASHVESAICPLLEDPPVSAPLGIMMQPIAAHVMQDTRTSHIAYLTKRAPLHAPTVIAILKVEYVNALATMLAISVKSVPKGTLVMDARTVELLDLGVLRETS